MRETKSTDTSSYNSPPISSNTFGPSVINSCCWCRNGSYDEIDFIEEMMTEEAKIKATKLGLVIRNRYNMPQCSNCESKKYDLGGIIDHISSDESDSKSDSTQQTSADDQDINEIINAYGNKEDENCKQNHVGTEVDRLENELREEQSKYDLLTKTSHNALQNLSDKGIHDGIMHNLPESNSLPEDLVCKMEQDVKNTKITSNQKHGEANNSSGDNGDKTDVLESNASVSNDKQELSTANDSAQKARDEIELAYLELQKNQDLANDNPENNRDINTKKILDSSGFLQTTSQENSKHADTAADNVNATNLTGTRSKQGSELANDLPDSETHVDSDHSECEQKSISKNGNLQFKETDENNDECINNSYDMQHKMNGNGKVVNADDRFGLGSHDDAQGADTDNQKDKTGNLPLTLITNNRDDCIPNLKLNRKDVLQSADVQTSNEKLQNGIRSANDTNEEGLEAKSHHPESSAKKSLVAFSANEAKIQSETHQTGKHAIRDVTGAEYQLGKHADDNGKNALITDQTYDNFDQKQSNLISVSSFNNIRDFESNSNDYRTANTADDNVNSFVCIYDEHGDLSKDKSLFTPSSFKKIMKEHSLDFKINKYVLSNDNRPIMIESENFEVNEDAALSAISSSTHRSKESPIKVETPCSRDQSDEMKHIMQIAKERVSTQPLYSNMGQNAPNHITRYVVSGKEMTRMMKDIISINDMKFNIIYDMVTKRGNNNMYQKNWFRLKDATLTCYNGKHIDISEESIPDDEKGDVVHPCDPNKYLTRKYSLDLKKCRLLISLNETTRYKFLGRMNCRKNRNFNLINLATRNIRQVYRYGKEYKIVIKESDNTESSYYMPFMEIALEQNETLYFFRFEEPTVFLKWILAIELRQGSAIWPIP